MCTGSGGMHCSCGRPHARCRSRGRAPALQLVHLLPQLRQLLLQLLALLQQRVHLLLQRIHLLVVLVLLLLAQPRQLAALLLGRRQLARQQLLLAYHLQGRGRQAGVMRGAGGRRSGGHVW